MPNSARNQFLFVFAQAHADFRIPELESISELYGFPIALPDPSSLDATSPFMVAELQESGHAVLLASRCILVK
jgi:tRNA (guanine10-N2)-methyltransferase